MGRGCARSAGRGSLTRAATRWPLTLPLPLTSTLAALRKTGMPVSHVGQAGEHGTQAVEQSQEGQEFGLGSEAQYQHALQGSGRLARLAAGAAEAAQSVGTLAAGSFRDAEVGAQKRAAELVLERGIATGKTARESVAKSQGFAGDLEGIQSLIVESRKRIGHSLVIGLPVAEGACPRKIFWRMALEPVGK